MFLFVIAVIFIVVFGGGGYVLSRRLKAPPPPQRGYPAQVNPKPIVKLGAIVFAVLGVLVLFLSGIRQVPVKSVGVLTSFGHVEGDLTPGFHWEAPWVAANILPETVQVQTWGGNNCLDIRIGGQQTACLYATIKWQVRDQAAPQLFNEYDTSGTNILSTISNAVVVREFEAVVNQVMGDYNPIYDVATNGTAGNSQFSTFTGKVQAAMRRDIGDQIYVQQVIIPFARYDSSTQSRLNTIQAQYAEAAIAQEQIQINDAQAKANAAIANNVSGGVLIAQCLSIVQNAEKTGYQLPAGFNCLGGGISGLSVAVK